MPACCHGFNSPGGHGPIVCIVLDLNCQFSPKVQNWHSARVNNRGRVSNFIHAVCKVTIV